MYIHFSFHLLTVTSRVQHLYCINNLSTLEKCYGKDMWVRYHHIKNTNHKTLKGYYNNDYFAKLTFTIRTGTSAVISQEDEMELDQ